MKIYFFIISIFFFFCSISEASSKTCIARLSFPTTYVTKKNLDETRLSVYSYSPADLNPFKVPQINSIWTKEFANIAFEAFEEGREEIISAPWKDHGEALIVYDSSDANTPVAITGFFPMNKARTRFGLRWHGVTQELQGRGISKWMVSVVVARIKKKYPQAETLVEQIPDIPSLASTAASFLSQGFTPTGNVFLPSWSRYRWRELELDIK